MSIFIFLFAGFQLVPFLLLVLVCGIAFYFIIVAMTKTAEKLAPLPPKLAKAIECLKAQALKHQGAIKDCGSVRRPELVFAYDGIELSISIDEGGKGEPSVTFARFKTEFFTDKNFRIASKKFKAFISFTKIKEFDSSLSPEFEFEGNDANFVKSVLTPQIESYLSEFKKATEVRFGDHTGVKYALKPNPGQLYICVEGIEDEDAGYDRLIETAIAFYEQFKILV